MRSAQLQAPDPNALAHDHASKHSFAVHELLRPGQRPSTPVGVFEGDANEGDGRRESECRGQDVPCDEGEDGFWKDVADWTRRRVCVTDLPELKQSL